MGNPRPSNPKKFVKGQVANPLGAGAHNKDLKAVRKLTQNELAEVGSMLLSSEVGKLKEMLEDPRVPLLKKWMIKIGLDGLKHGNFSTFDGLLNRLIGKVPDKVQLDGQMKQSITTNDLERIREAKRRFESEY